MSKVALGQGRECGAQGRLLWGGGDWGRGNDSRPSERYADDQRGGRRERRGEMGQKADLERWKDIAVRRKKEIIVRMYEVSQLCSLRHSPNPRTPQI